MTKRLIVDGSSICWYALLAGKDEEFGQVVEHEGKQVHVNGWQYGYENAINSLVAAWEKTGAQPHNTIWGFERGNSKGFRRQFLETYKDKPSDSRPPQAYEQFNILRDKLIETVRSLGGVAVTRPHMECDDLIAWIVSMTKGERIVMSQDRDLAALLTVEGVRLWRSSAYLDENPYGPFPCKLLPVYKALVGDTSDAIPGAKGFGEKAFLNMLAMFDVEGLEEVERMIVEKRLHELEPNVADLKVISKIIENKSMVEASYFAGKLYPEMVESMRVPVEWFPGYVKQKSEIEDERLKKYAGTSLLVHKGNYRAALARFRESVKDSEYVALDIETSTPPESDDWLREIKGGGKAGQDEDLGVDVLGSELTGMAITFGANQQHTIYMTCRHKGEPGIENLEVGEILDMVMAIPKGTPIAIHNVAFEQPVLYQEFGFSKLWKENGWHGFLPNAHDTKIMASYVDENFSSGLKKLSKRWFDYDQASYQEVTQGRKMNELTAREVFAYGTDDTIMTSGLYSFFKLFMECEGTWDAFEKVEVLPAYLTALAFVQGIKFSMEELRRIEEEDAQALAKHQAVIFDYLIEQGWEGTVTPTYTVEDLEVPAKIKEIVGIVLEGEFKTMVRTPSKIFKLIEAFEAEGSEALAALMEEGNVEEINRWVASKYDGTPKIDLSSSRQMQKLLYEVMGLPPRLINPLTEKQRENKELANAVYKFNKIYRGSKGTSPLTPEEIELVKTRATTDKFAIEFAIAFDGPERPELVPVLKAIQGAGQIITRQNLFYTPYPRFIHWKTGRVHPHLNQSATVTRRYSSSRFNVQQMSKKGEGVKVRGVIRPHKKGALIVSLDFSGQELRLGADLSKDENMLACYVGDNLRDMHSIMTSHPNMVRRWGEKLPELETKYGFDLANASLEDYYHFFRTVYESEDRDDHKLADDLRKLGKNVVFGAAYSAEAPTLAKNMTVRVDEAQAMLDAKREMFPRYEVWKDEVVREAHRKGYVEDVMGVRRHLRDGLCSDNKWDIEKAERQAVNSVIQNSAASQTKLAMSKVWASGVLQAYDAQFIAPIHDEIVVSVARSDLLPVLKVLHECMTGTFLGEVPEVSSIAIGPDFANQYECGDTYDESEILKQLAKIPTE